MCKRLFLSVSVWKLWVNRWFMEKKGHAIRMQTRPSTSRTQEVENMSVIRNYHIRSGSICRRVHFYLEQIWSFSPLCRVCLLPGKLTNAPPKCSVWKRNSLSLRGPPPKKVCECGSCQSEKQRDLLCFLYAKAFPCFRTLSRESPFPNSRFSRKFYWVSDLD